ncbi:short chain dehydrogenase [Agrocybe pediades]|nr:short chain dehydrogenase [Agrocybe pediades]
MSKQLVWVITGTSSGLGRDLTIAALKRGDKVIATGRARSISKLKNLEEQGANILELDVTSPIETLHEVAKKAVAIYGRVDVLVNNAGYILVGAIEENTPQETFDQFNTNVFGALNVTRAFLPYMREKRTGTIVWMGSLGGWKSTPYAGLYSTTKWALRGISETLHEEISPLGLRSICIDFGYFRTSFLQTEQRAPKVERISDYREVGQRVEAALQAYNGKQPGDPKKGVELVLDLVRGEGEAAGRPLPVGIAFGSDAYNVAKTASEQALARLEEWKDVSFSTDFSS